MIDIVFVTHKIDDKIEGILNELRSTLNSNHRLIITGLRASASVNRNYGLRQTTSQKVVMVDNDIRGYYKGWVEDLVAPLPKEAENNILLASARLLNPDGTIGSCMGSNGIPTDSGVYDGERISYRRYYRLPTACLGLTRGLLNSCVNFDEGFLGSGYEDTAWMNNLNIKHPDKRFVINNNCKLIHENNQSNQGGVYWKWNKEHYLSLFPDDTSVVNQKDWTLNKGK